MILIVPGPTVWQNSGMNRCSASSSTSELCQDCAYHASAVAAAGLATELHPAARGAHRRRRRAPRQRAGVGRAVEPHGRHPRAVRPLRGCCNRGGARAAPRAAGEQCHDRRQPVSCFRVIFTRCSSTLGDYFCWSSLVLALLFLRHQRLVSPGPRKLRRSAQGCWWA